MDTNQMVTFMCKAFIIVGTMLVSTGLILFIMRPSTNLSLLKMSYLVGIMAITIGALTPHLLSEPAEPIDRSAYTVYLDGQEVDSDKVDMSLYSVKYDDEKEIAYITHKNSDNDGLIGGIIGFFIGRGTAK